MRNDFLNSQKQFLADADFGEGQDLEPMSPPAARSKSHDESQRFGVVGQSPKKNENSRNLMKNEDIER